MLAVAMGLAGCNQETRGYVPVAAIARDGFLRDEGSVAEAPGREVRLWGFVDQGNLYGDAVARRILGEWWSGDGPDVDHWRFNLKAQADDPVGHSFAVLVPNDSGREDLLERFVDDARARRSTQVFLTDRLFTFDAPLQFLDRTGLYLQLLSSQDIQLDPPDEGENLGMSHRGPLSGSVERAAGLPPLRLLTAHGIQACRPVKFDRIDRDTAQRRGDP